MPTRRVVRVSGNYTSSSSTYGERVVVKGGRRAQRVRRVSGRSFSVSAGQDCEKVVYCEEPRRVVKQKRHCTKVVQESTSTSTEVVEKHLPKKKKIRNVVVEQSQSTSTEIVEKILPKRVKHKQVVQHISQSTSTEVVEKVLPKRVKQRNIVHHISQSTSTEVVEVIKPRKHKKIIREIEQPTSTTTAYETCLKPKKHKTQVVHVSQSSTTETHVRTEYKPKKHKTEVHEIQQSSTTVECVEEVLKPKKHKQRTVQVVQQHDDEVRCERIKARKQKREVCREEVVDCAPVTRVIKGGQSRSRIVYTTSSSSCYDGSRVVRVSGGGGRVIRQAPKHGSKRVIIDAQGRKKIIK